MAVYVVTATSELVIYQEANYVERHQDGKTQLYKSKSKDQWVADIPSTWAVGFGRPHFPVNDSALARIKRALRNFDSRTGRFHQE